MKKFLAAAAAALMLTMTGCTITSSRYNAMEDYDFSQMELIQLQPPKEGDTIAIVDTSMGEIRVVLYEEQAPNTVAAFIEQAQAGKYDNIPVYGIMTDVYFLTGGKENKHGMYVGRDSDEELVANEYSVDLWPFRGALISFSEKVGYGDSRWYIVNTDAANLTEEAIGELKNSVSEIEDPIAQANLLNLFDKFYEVGGVFGLAGTCTVYGQTYEGFDVIEAICAVKADENNRPTKEVMINSVTISEYTAE